VPSRPNIVLIVADDHRFDAAGALGNPAVHTPALDALAGAGVAFGRTYIMGGYSGAVCVPSRACLLTGTDVFSATRRPDAGAGWAPADLNPELLTLPEVFRAADYHTHGIGKWHNGKRSFGRGFAGGARIFFGGMSDHRAVPLHDFDASGAYPDTAARKGAGFSSELFADAAVDFVRGYRGQAPFLLYLAFTAPHDPRTPPAEFAARYDPDAVSLPPNWLPDHPFDNGELRIRDEELDAHPRTAGALRRHIAGYYAMITHMDAQIGRVLHALHRSGRGEDTLVAYTADHGLAVGQHGLLGKQNLYDCSVRVPLLLAGPGLPRGRRVEGLHHAHDILPTLCALTGVAAPAAARGRSLLPLLAGDPGAARPSVHAVYRDLQRMVCDGRWKLIRYYRRAETGPGTDRLQLFDLSADPWEMRDLSAEPGQRGQIARLAADLADWQRRVGDPLAPVPVVPGV